MTSNSEQPDREGSAERQVGTEIQRRNGETRTFRIVQPAALDVHGAAELLGVSRGLVEKMNAAGELPRPLRLHRRRVWSRAVLEAWLEAGAPNRETWEARRGERP